MISKKSPPQRPPLPTRYRKAETTGQQQDENQKRLDLFSIRFSRDDANGSDEEISIVRKETSPDVQSEPSEDIKNENVQDKENDDTTSPSSGTSSLLSSLYNNTLSLLPKSPVLNNGSGALTPDEQTKQKPTESSVGEIVFKATHFEEDSDTSLSSPNESNGRTSSSPPVTKRKDNPVVHSAMSLSSLLKKEMEQRTPFGKGSSQEGRGHVELPKTKGFLASALVDSSRLLMPIGFGDFNSEVPSAVKQEDALSYTEIPIYNMLLMSVVVFLYFMLPSSSFLNGFVFGGILTFFLVFALMWLLTPEMSDEEKYKRDVLDHEREMMSLRKAPKLPSEILQPWQLYQQHDLEGWFFQAEKYNPLEPVDFSDLDNIQPVYASLSGHTLTLLFPKQDDLPKIKRSSMLAKNDNIKFSDSKEYNLGNGGEIELAPETLTLKRLWAKKYPIYLKLFVKPPTEETDRDTADDTFVLPSVTEEMFLFSPTSRAKEEWYYRMERGLKPPTHGNEIENIFNTQAKRFPYYMAELIGADRKQSSQTQLTWVNALLGRLFWDVWKSEYWNSKAKTRIQNKISRMKLPPFIRYLKVTDIKLGHALPKIQSANNLHQDDRGIWVDLEVDYEGGIMLTIETMVNLEYYLRQLTDQGKSDGDEVILKFSREDSSYSDVSSAESDVDEGWDDAPMTFVDGRSPSISSEGSASGGENAISDNEVDAEPRSMTSSASPLSEQEGWAGKVKNSKGKKILNMLEKVAKSKWVQKAAETKVVQRAVEKFSNLPIELSVEVVRLRGTLAANIPPPPSNRLWLGFHTNHFLSLRAKPKLGERNVRLTHVTEWIEYKLKQEFKSMFVLPNMEDLTIRIMDSGFEDKFPPS